MVEGERRKERVTGIEFDPSTLNVCMEITMKPLYAINACQLYIYNINIIKWVIKELQGGAV
jgi:hypothetical protein